MSDKKNLAAHAARGGGVMLASRGVQVVCQLASVAFLSRLLDPEDFGLVAIVASSIAIISLFRELGLTLAIIQKDDVTDRALNSVFRITIVLGLLLLLAASLIGSITSYYFERKELIYIAPFFGLIAMITSLEVVPLGLLRRELKFKQIAVREICAISIGTATGIAAACMGWGYWALVVAPLVSQSCNTLLSWWAVDWSPRQGIFSREDAITYMKFGGAVTLSDFSNYLCQNLDRFLIGKIWGFTPLGYYTRSQALIVAPINQITIPMASVLMPIFSRIKNDNDRVEQWLKEILTVLALAGGVGAAIIAASSNEVVNLLLGSGWEDVADILFNLAPLLLLRPIGSLLYSLMVSGGHLKNLMSWTWIGASLTILGIVIGVGFGVKWLALGVVISTFCRGFVAAYFVSKTFQIRMRVMTDRIMLGVFYGIATYWIIYAILQQVSNLSISDITAMIIKTILGISCLLITLGCSKKYRTAVLDYLKK